MLAIETFIFKKNVVTCYEQRQWFSAIYFIKLTINHYYLAPNSKCWKSYNNYSIIVVINKKTIKYLVFILPGNSSILLKAPGISNNKHELADIDNKQ